MHEAARTGSRQLRLAATPCDQAIADSATACILICTRGLRTTRRQIPQSAQDRRSYGAFRSRASYRLARASTFAASRHTFATSGLLARSAAIWARSGAGARLIISAILRAISSDA